MSLGVTDTPVDGVQQVVVAFTGVTLMGPDGQQSFQFATEQSVNLLTLQGNASQALLSNVTVPAGQYQWLRLDIDTAHSYVISSTGGQYPLNIPSGDQSGLKLVSGFTVAQGGLSDFTIDFNLRQSLTEDNASGTTTYTLTPALRLVNAEEVGSISGTALNTMTIGGESITNANCDPAVYVYPGSTTVFNGFDVTISGGTTPITSGTLTLNSTTGFYDYTIGFLAPGTYVVAATCAGNDTSSSVSLAFSVPQTVDVTANSTTTVNFS
ncbi:lipoprotein [mine drainage metagenome]|uniref:Lipoprotein n=1 Tax=mine drainage metagenome TaxID=410659 RepID=T1C4F8_9ZZZZ